MASRICRARRNRDQLQVVYSSAPSANVRGVLLLWRTATTSENFASSKTLSPDVAFTYVYRTNPDGTNTVLNPNFPNHQLHSTEATDLSEPASQAELFAWHLEYFTKTACLLNDLSTFMSSDLCSAGIPRAEPAVNNENILRAFLKKHHILP